MMAWNRPRNLILGTMLLSSALSAAEDTFHIVKRGQTLSKIARGAFPGGVYGEGGSLAKILTLNPEIKNPDLIFPGQRVLLGERSEPEPRPLDQASQERAQQPIAAPDTIANDGKGPVSRLGIDVGFAYSRIDSKDKVTGSSSTFLSDMSPRVVLTWDLEWTEKWISRLRFTHVAEKILDDGGVNPRTLENAVGARSGFEIGGLYRWSEASRTGLSTGFEQRFFTHAVDASRISIDRVSEPFVRLSHEIDLARVKTAVIGVGLSVEAILPGRGPGYDTEQGQGADARVFLRHEMKNIAIQGSVGYGVFRQNSTLVEQKGSHVDAMVGLLWRFGE